MNLAWSIRTLSPPEKAVLVALADRADDTTAQTWIPIRSLQGKLDLITMTSLSERSVQNAIKALTTAGHLTRVENPGHGVLYTVHPRTSCTPAEDAPPQEVRPAAEAPTPAPPAPKPSINLISPDADASVEREPASKRARACRLPDDWEPESLASDTVAGQAITTWAPGMLERELSKFRDWARGSGRRMVDWQATWRNWVVRADEQQPRSGGRGGSRNGNGMLAAVIDAEHRDRFG